MPYEVGDKVTIRDDAYFLAEVRSMVQGKVGVIVEVGGFHWDYLVHYDNVARIGGDFGFLARDIRKV